MMPPMLLYVCPYFAGRLNNTKKCSLRRCSTASLVVKNVNTLPLSSFLNFFIFHSIFHPVCCMVDNIITVFFPFQVIAERSHGNDYQTLQELQQENLLQTSARPSSPRSRHRWSQHRHQGVLPPPEPEEDSKLFILDLRNFPELANADMGSQNPNIQVGNKHMVYGEINVFLDSL